MKLKRKYELRQGEVMAVTEVERHRNGIGGLGFYAVAFVLQDPRGFVGYDTPDGKYAPDANAVYDYVETEFIATYDDDGRVQVVCPSDISRTMRGHDYFGDAVLKAVNAYERAKAKEMGWSPTRHTLLVGA